jgi:hypothetical protein
LTEAVCFGVFTERPRMDLRRASVEACGWDLRVIPLKEEKK